MDFVQLQGFRAFPAEPFEGAADVVAVVVGDIFEVVALTNDWQVKIKPLKQI